jgi:hypothetical protein
LEPCESRFQQVVILKSLLRAGHFFELLANNN